MSNEIIKAWYQASRAKFFIATLIPLVLGGVIAWQEGGRDISLWLVTLLASFLIHVNTNLANDYFEYSTGADDGDSIGGSRVLQEGKITIKQIRNVMIIVCFIALICGIWILYKTQLWWLIGIILFSFFSSLFYTAPPFRYGYHGLGELFVGLNMGPIMVAGTTAVMVGGFSARSLYLSIPIGIMVAFILFYQSLSDIVQDREVGKNTLAVKLGRNKIIYGFRAFAFLSVFSIVILVLTGQVHYLALISIATILILVRIDKIIITIATIQELHDLGKPVRIFYLINSAILIFSEAFLR